MSSPNPFRHVSERLITKSLALFGLLLISSNWCSTSQSEPLESKSLGQYIEALSKTDSRTYELKTLTEFPEIDPEQENVDRNWRKSRPEIRSLTLERALSRTKRSTIVFSYKILQYPHMFDKRRPEIDAQIRRAMNIWSLYAPIEFVPWKHGTADFELEFSKTDFGHTVTHRNEDGSKPIKIHIEDRELTIDASGVGIDISQTVLHELGHGFGIDESELFDSIMYPGYRLRVPLVLHPSDIAVIQRIFGKREPPAKAETANSSESAKPIDQPPSLSVSEASQ